MNPVKRISNILRKISRKIILFRWNKYRKSVFSQEGEELLLERVFENRTTGTYVDIGAHHPIRFSNTFQFYLDGWNGINIDATPQSMVPFLKYRKRDINIECGVGKKETNLKFHMFAEPALNTFDSELAQKRVKEGFDIKREVTVPVRRLENILAEHWKAGTEIDFFSIDTEGVELQVLQSNDWEKWRPKVIMCELLKVGSLDHLAESDIVIYLKEQDYDVYASLYNTVTFIDRRYKFETL